MRSISLRVRGFVGRRPAVARLVNHLATAVRSNNSYHQGWQIIAEIAAFRALRMVMTGWACSNYVKASVLSRSAKHLQLLYKTPMARSLQQVLAIYHLSMFYITLRMLGAELANGDVFIMLSRVLAANLSDTRKVVLVTMGAAMCMDEVVHACAVASLDFKKRLATMPCLLPKGERRCTICHEDEFEAGDDESEHLVSFCASGLHPTHVECMQRWFTCGQRGASMCPVCRMPLRTVRPSFVPWQQTFNLRAFSTCHGIHLCVCMDMAARPSLVHGYVAICEQYFPYFKIVALVGAYLTCTGVDHRSVGYGSVC
eukprot:m.1298531 g.1298531  ORF g.1298531 m.1298531 type:complete len:313 (-) comp24798_c1_seq81:2755-3693(-)